MSRYHRLQADDAPLVPRLKDIDHCIVANSEFLEDVCTSARQSSLLQSNGAQNGALNSSSAKSKPKPKVTDHEMEKLRSTLRQLHRDWSLEVRSIERYV